MNACSPRSLCRHLPRRPFGDGFGHRCEATAIQPHVVGQVRGPERLIALSFRTVTRSTSGLERLFTRLAASAAVERPERQHIPRDVGDLPGLNAAPNGGIAPLRPSMMVCLMPSGVPGSQSPSTRFGKPLATAHIGAVALHAVGLEQSVANRQRALPVGSDGLDVLFGVRVEDGRTRPWPVSLHLVQRIGTPVEQALEHRKTRIQGQIAKRKETR